MSKEQSFAASERNAVKHLMQLKFKWGKCGFSLNEKGEISRLDLTGVIQCDDETIKALADLKSLRQFTADGITARDLLFQVLGQLPCLEEITIWEVENVSDFALVALSAAPRLRRLNLRGIQVSDAGATAIGRIGTLMSLECQLQTNNGIFELRNLTDLNTLDLGGSSIDDDSMINLARFSDLVFLSLERTKVTGHGCVHLRSCLKLEYANFSDTEFNDEGLIALGGLTQLKSLSLSRTRIRDDGIVFLAALPSLTRLQIVGCSISDASVPALSKCLKLKELYAEESLITLAGKKKLKQLLPRCVVYVSKATQELDTEDDKPPFEKKNYFWQHPPECLKRFELTKKRKKELPEYATCFRLACTCGHSSGHIFGYPLATLSDSTPLNAASSKLFVGPLSFRCDKCSSLTEIIDTDNDGYHGRLGCSAVYHGKGAPEPFVCPDCAGENWQAQATVQMNEAAFDLWYDDPEIAIENYFDVFRLWGTCTKCKSVTIIADFENLG